MPAQKYVWIVERKIGNWASWVGKAGRRNKGPMPNESGKMKFGKGDYAIDPKKFRVWKIPKGIKAGDIVKVQLWPEDVITPADYLASDKKVGDDFTATMLQRVANIKSLELSKTNKETEKVVMFLAVALIIAMGVIGVMAYLVVNH